ncbi:xanthine dehydrogenase accessory protein XdhC [Sulfitobacter aestuarii]|uniref:Xanthine dehydrogenase accessory protein XdhC n=1 Tax=Sulfitobacter aestuarii TaxID=2161676 RepID=A0ABW5U4R8_9RHOB
MARREPLRDFLARHAEVIHVRITRVRGSSPRDEGAEMFVAADEMRGTIGGGQLEYMALDEARALLRSGHERGHMDVPLGPEIGQCCGGRVEIALQRMDSAAREAATRAAGAEEAARPHVYVLGAGHIGRELAHCFARLPVRPVLVDSRAEELRLCSAQVEMRHCALPEAEIDAAPPGSAFIVLSHDHALDFLLSAQALARGDAAYVGMIGSATKRAKFERFCRGEIDGVATQGLTCPIGAGQSGDKRPEVIAAFVAAEVMAALSRNEVTTPRGSSVSIR